MAAINSAKPMCIYQLACACMTVLGGIYRGCRKQLTFSLIAFISYYIIGLPLAYGFGFGLDLSLKGLWYGLGIGALCGSITSLVHSHFLLIGIRGRRSYQR